MWEREKLIVNCWKECIAKLQNLFPSLSLNIYMCLCVCLCVNVIFMLALRCMSTGFACVWIPFDAYSDQYSILRRWVIYIFVFPRCFVELVSSFSTVKMIVMLPQVINMSSKYRVSNMTYLLSMLRMITECSKWRNKISATKLGVGDPIANPLNGLLNSFFFYWKFYPFNLRLYKVLNSW